MRIEEKDFAVLRYLVRHGWTTAPNLYVDGFWTNLQSAYRRLKQLKDEGLIHHEQKLKKRAGIYRISRHGFNLIKQEHERRYSLDELKLSEPPKPNLIQYDHHLGIQYIASNLLSHSGYDEGEVRWETERELRSRHYPGRFTQAGHTEGDLDDENPTLETRLPDGVFVMEREGMAPRRYAVEFDHSKKNAEKVRSMIEAYGHKFDCPYDGVLFYGNRPNHVKRIQWQIERADDGQLAPRKSYYFKNKTLDDLRDGGFDLPDWVFDEGTAKENRYGDPQFFCDVPWDHMNVIGCEPGDNLNVEETYANEQTHFNVDESKLIKPPTIEREIMDGEDSYYE